MNKALEKRTQLLGHTLTHLVHDLPLDEAVAVIAETLRTFAIRLPAGHLQTLADMAKKRCAGRHCECHRPEGYLKKFLYFVHQHEMGSKRKEAALVKRSEDLAKAHGTASDLRPMQVPGEEAPSGNPSVNPTWNDVPGWDGKPGSGPYPSDSEVLRLWESHFRRHAARVGPELPVVLAGKGFELCQTFPRAFDLENVGHQIHALTKLLAEERLPKPPQGLKARISTRLRGVTVVSRIYWVEA